VVSIVKKFELVGKRIEMGSSALIEILPFTTPPQGVSCEVFLKTREPIGLLVDLILILGEAASRVVEIAGFPLVVIELEPIISMNKLVILQMISSDKIALFRVSVFVSGSKLTFPSPRTSVALSLVTSMPPIVRSYVIVSSALAMLGKNSRVVRRIVMILVDLLRLSNRLVIILAINGLILVFIKNLGKYTIFIDNFQIKISFYLILRIIAWQ
jgi:hypothetical protein